MDFQQEKYAKGAARYDKRIRNTFPFTKLFTQQLTPCCEVFCGPRAVC